MIGMSGPGPNESNAATRFGQRASRHVESRATQTHKVWFDLVDKLQLRGWVSERSVYGLPQFPAVYIRRSLADFFKGKWLNFQASQKQTGT